MIFNGVPYVRLTKALAMMPLSKEEARELLLVEVGPAIRDKQGNSPLTYFDPRTHWWVEKEEFSDVMNKYWPKKKKGDLK